MSRCRARSFYVAPGERRYFGDCTLATRGPDGAWVEFTHRDDVARHAAEHPDWDGVCWVGPPGGSGVLADALQKHPQDVEMWRLDARGFEGRRPADPAQFALHRAVSGGVGRAGGARQLAVDAFPGAGRGVLAAAEGAARAGELGRVWALSAVWRAGLLRDERVSELLSERAMSPLPLMFDGLGPELAVAALGGLSDAERAAVLRDLVDPFAAETTWPLLAHSTSDPELLARLALSEEEVVRRLVATNPATSLETLEHLARTDRFLSVLRHVAERAQDRHLLDLLAQRGGPPLSAVLDTATCPPDLVAAAAAASIPETRRRAVAHPNCPPEVLAGLATDEDVRVRTSVARAATDPVLLAQLSGDTDRGVSDAALANPACPPEALESALFVHGFLNRAVLRNPACPPELLWWLASRVERSDVELLTSAPACPPELLEDLVERFDPDLVGSVSRAAAGSASLSPPLAERLSAGPDQELQERVAANSRAGADVIRDLLADPAPMVAINAARNTALPLGEVASLLVDPVSSGKPSALEAATALRTRAWGKNECDDPAEVARWASSPSVMLRGIAATQVNCPPEVLARLVEDPSAVVHMAALENESLPPEVLAALVESADDVDEVVKSHQVQSALTRLWAGGERRAATLLAGRTKHTDAVLAAALAESAMVVPASAKVDRLFEAAAIQSVQPLQEDRSRVRSVADLPGSADVPFGLAGPGQGDAADRVAGVRARTATGDELTLRVIPTPRALSENANFMGNCTASYRSSISKGQKVILAADDPAGETVFNVELAAPAQAGGPWVIGEVNSRFNAGFAGAGPLVDRLVDLGFAISTETARDLAAAVGGDGA